MTANVSPFLKLVTQAYEGRLKLPAFQRNWKWQRSQVILLYDSLRQGFPIGSFLFLKSGKRVDLSPREFRGAGPNSKAYPPERLVLDGQQRLTAGLELFYGNGPTRYFLDIEKLIALAQEDSLRLEDADHVAKFVADLDVEEDRYCISRTLEGDASALLCSKHLLCTSLLVDEAELSRALRIYKKQFVEREDFVDFVLQPYFKPSEETQVPVTEIEDDIPVEGISRIFATLNTTGKLLTPFELVVALLFPRKINLTDDVQAAKEIYPYYKNIDKFGDLFLQTLALFAGKDTKKASLPRTITEEVYREFSDDAFHYLNEAGKLLTIKGGAGLDTSDELLIYPVIFPPMAYVLRILANRKEPLGPAKEAQLHRKLVRWFIGAVLNRRYQQSTHDRQIRDKTEIMRWLDGEGDEDAPAWLSDVYIPNLRDKKPEGAPGKMLRGLMNLNHLRDPLTNDPIGVRPQVAITDKHHIFPTRFVTSLKGWSKDDTNDVAANIMYLGQSTNIAWHNLDPHQQLKQAFNAQGESNVRATLKQHLVSDECIEIMLRQNKTAEDFRAFLEARDRAFVEALNSWGFARPSVRTGLDEDDQDED